MDAKTAKQALERHQKAARETTNEQEEPLEPLRGRGMGKVVGTTRAWRRK